MNPENQQHSTSNDLPDQVYRVGWVRADLSRSSQIVEARSGRQAIGRAIPEWDNDVRDVFVRLLVEADQSITDTPQSRSGSSDT